jgi:hypothetical protein
MMYLHQRHGLDYAACRHAASCCCNVVRSPRVEAEQQHERDGGGPVSSTLALTRRFSGKSPGGVAANAQELICNPPGAATLPIEAPAKSASLLLLPSPAAASRAPAGRFRRRSAAQRPTHRAECSPGTSRSFSCGILWSSGSPGDALPPPGDAAPAEDLSGVAGSACSSVRGSAAAASEAAGE